MMNWWGKYSKYHKNYCIFCNLVFSSVIGCWLSYHFTKWHFGIFFLHFKVFIFFAFTFFLISFQISVKIRWTVIFEFLLVKMADSDFSKKRPTNFKVNSNFLIWRVQTEIFKNLMVFIVKCIKMKILMGQNKNLNSKLI